MNILHARGNKSSYHNLSTHACGADVSERYFLVAGWCCSSICKRKLNQFNCDSRHIITIILNFDKYLFDSIVFTHCLGLKFERGCMKCQILIIFSYLFVVESLVLYVIGCDICMVLHDIFVDFIAKLWIENYLKLLQWFPVRRSA